MRGFWPPPLWVPAEVPAKKWLGRRGGLWIAAGGVAFFLYLMLVGGLALHNGAAVTIGLLVGAVTVAASFLYTMAYRIGPRDTVTVPLLLIAFGFGGLLAVTVGSTTDSLLVKLTGHSEVQTNTVVLLLAGISEELAKIIAVVVVSWRLKDKSIRNGLFVGGAVGLGFAALEDLSYAQSFYQDPPALIHLTHLGSALVFVPVRALLTPFGHPLWTALFAAGLFAAARNGRFRVTWKVVVAYLGVSVAHGLWDGSAGVLDATGIKPLVLLELLILPGIVVGSGLIWIHVARKARWDFQTPVAWWRAGPPHPAHQVPPPAPPDPRHRLPVPPGAWPPPPR
ncbi:PrsW family intramembrane metalloprotease [Frondihabitans cladoniiphilus]|uniref:RsiW-degrading membrane proteinase PrsW (M82 family) n=1 Tax=Frondihabitans cladoniiphilus TaxID=715785 RepID=A0ABP8VJS5_9MICO